MRATLAAGNRKKRGEACEYVGCLVGALAGHPFKKEVSNVSALLQSELIFVIAKESERFIVRATTEFPYVL